MRRHGLYWGIGLIALGLLLLLDILQLLPFDVSALILPLLLILAGIWVIWGLSRPRQVTGESSLRIPLEAAETLRLRLRHGAGRLKVDCSGGESGVLTGEFGILAHAETQRAERSLAVRLHPADDWFFLSAPWAWQRGDRPDWAVHLPTTASLELDLQTGASDAVLDLTRARLAGLRFEAGASSAELHLPPPQGVIAVRIKGGAGAIRLTLSPGTAAQVVTRTTLGAITLDPNHFTRQGAIHTTADFAQAIGRYEIEVSVVAGSVDVTRRPG